MSPQSSTEKEREIQLSKTLNEEMERMKKNEKRIEQYKPLFPKVAEGISHIERAILKEPYKELKGHSIK